MHHPHGLSSFERAGTADTTRMRYNAAREQVGVISADPDGSGPLKHRASRTIIDGTSGLVTRSDIGTVDSQSDTDWANMAVHQSVSIEHDAQRRPVVQRLTSGTTTYALTQTSYDSLSRPRCTAQRMNPAEFASLPTLGRAALGKKLSPRQKKGRSEAALEKFLGEDA